MEEVSRGKSSSRLQDIDSVRLIGTQAHPNAKKWRKTPFPLFDDMAGLVDGTVATGEGAYHPGQPAHVPAMQLSQRPGTLDEWPVSVRPVHNLFILC